MEWLEYFHYFDVSVENLPGLPTKETLSRRFHLKVFNARNDYSPKSNQPRALPGTYAGVGCGYQVAGWFDFVFSPLYVKFVRYLNGIA